MKVKSKSYKLMLWLLSVSVIAANAQSAQKAFFGIGGGLDYGGLGLRGELQPNKNISIFVGAGYNFAAPAFNAGASYKIVTGGRAQPFLTAMYGYNAVIKIKNAFADDYYGFTTGVGCELYERDGKRKWLFELLIPFRRQEFHDQYQELKDFGYEFNPGILPVTFTIGYNFLVSSHSTKR